MKSVTFAAALAVFGVVAGVSAANAASSSTYFTSNTNTVQLNEYGNQLEVGSLTLPKGTWLVTQTEQVVMQPYDQTDPVFASINCYLVTPAGGQQNYTAGAVIGGTLSYFGTLSGQNVVSVTSGSAVVQLYCFNASSVDSGMGVYNVSLSAVVIK